MSEDGSLVAAQLGREPGSTWRVAHRCSHGRPSVIANAPSADDGTPFPTLYWLTCPHLTAVVSDVESTGETARWTDRLAADERLRFEMLAADQQYRAARQIEGAGEDPCCEVGIAGQRDPCATKCLHAHVATYLAGIPDPVGRETLTGRPTECEADDCAALLVRYESGS